MRLDGWIATVKVCCCSPTTAHSHTGSPTRATSRPRPIWPRSKVASTKAALAALRRGVRLNDGPTLPAEAAFAAEPDWLWPRDPPVRFRQAIPTSWLSLTLREGRNRQVRRMTAAVGFPTLRLIRVRVGDHTLDGLAPGESRVLTV